MLEKNILAKLDENNFKYTILIFIYVFLFSTPLYADNDENEVTANYARNEVLILGRVSKGPRSHYRAFDAMGRYLVKHMGDLGIKSYELNFPRSNEEMIHALRDGKIDFLSETPFSALLFEQTTNAKILLRQWKSGVPSYNTLFIAKKDSEIGQLSDLAGRKIAFEDSGSTSAYFVPKMALRNIGFNVVQQDDADFITNTKTIRYIFSGSEENILYSILRNKVDAGAMSNLDWEDPDKAPLGLKENIKIFHITPNILRSLFLARADASPSIQERIISLLITMHENEEGLEVLNKYFKVGRFDHLEGDAEKDLEYARKLYAEFLN